MGQGSQSSAIADNKPLYPWPDITASYPDFVYLHSSRFDKFFRMDCDLSATADWTINYIVDTLKLPWNKDVPQLGMKWSFSYRLIFNKEGIGLSKSLREVGVSFGSVLKMGINSTYEDVWENMSKAMWDGTKVYHVTSAIRHETQLEENIRNQAHLRSLFH